MALTDVNFQEGEGQDFIVELPSAVYSGSLNDIVVEPNGSQFPVSEIPIVENAGGNIFIMSE